MYPIKAFFIWIEAPPPPEEQEEEEEIIYVPVSSLPILNHNLKQYYLQQIIQKVVIDYAIHGNFAKLYENPANVAGVRFLYLYRKSENGVPYFESAELADSEMPSYFLLGICTGNVLHTLTFLSKEASNVSL